MRANDAVCEVWKQPGLLSDQLRAQCQTTEYIKYVYEVYVYEVCASAMIATHISYRNQTEWMYSSDIPS
jgi:hypothetical protein